MYQGIARVAELIASGALVAATEASAGALGKPATRQPSVGAPLLN